jgi:hypothetical protein
MEGPLKVEIIAYAPTAFYHCQHCELVWDQTRFSQGVRQEQINSGLPQDLLHEYAAISDWVRQLFARYCDRVAVKVIDAVSVEGVWKSLRYGVHRYPAIIVDGHDKTIGMDLSLADASVARRLAPAPSP